MRAKKMIVCLMLVLFLGIYTNHTTIPSEAQTQSLSSLSDSLKNKIETKESTWKLTKEFPMKDRLVVAWEHEKDKVDAFIFDEGTSEQAAKTLNVLRERAVGRSKRISAFGEECYSYHNDGRMQAVDFRTKQYFVEVQGSSEEVIFRFAKYIDDELGK
jgi:hypothetical protein